MHASTQRSPTFRPLRLLLAGAALAMTLASAARADIMWSWSYSGAGVTASGLLTTADAPNSNGLYQVLGITGQRNGVGIARLYPTGYATPGNDPAPGNDPYLLDNLVGPNGEMTKAGVGFETDDGTYSNLFFASWLTPATHLEFFTAPDGNGGYNGLETAINFTMTRANAVPEPGSLALTAIAGAALLLSRRRKSSSLKG